MSQENVEIVEALFAGTAGMDKQVLLAALPELIAQTCTPDILDAERILVFTSFIGRGKTSGPRGGADAG
jgi:hypothetical protein